MLGSSEHFVRFQSGQQEDLQIRCQLFDLLPLSGCVGFVVSLATGTPVKIFLHPPSCKELSGVQIKYPQVIKAGIRFVVFLFLLQDLIYTSY